MCSFEGTEGYIKKKREQMMFSFFCLPGKFVEIVLVSKNAPRGSHCGGAENVAIATRRRRRMSQETFFIPLLCRNILSEDLKKAN